MSSSPVRVPVHHRNVSHSGAQQLALATYCTRRLRALCIAAGFGPQTEEVLDTFNRLIEPWGSRPVAADNGWVSDISDDNTPVEFSAAISEGRVQVRVLLEAQADAPTVAAHRRAALELTERLEREHGAYLGRFHRVADLFMPEDMSGPFALWHSVVFDRDRPPMFKAYFNPQARGRENSAALVAEGLARLGMRECYAAVGRTARRGPHLDELKYFALDLTDDPSARVKVYVRHHSASPDDLERACSGAERYAPGEVSSFVRVMAGDRERLTRRATFTCTAFHEGSAKPSATTVYVPVCAYADDDAAVVDRVSAYLAAHGMDPAPYRNLIEGYANRKLEEGTGMQSWAAFRRLSGERLTVYLATEARHVFPPGSIPAGTGDRLAFDDANAAVSCVLGYDLGCHPCVRSIAESGDRARAWAVARVLHEGGRHVARWLPLARVALDRAMRNGTLERLPQTELGGSAAPGELLRALEEARPPSPDPRLVTIERAFAEHVDRLVATDDVERLAALAMLEVCATQVSSALAQAARLDAASCDAVAAAGRAYPELASCIARVPAAVAAFGRGALAAHAALWNVLDELLTIWSAASPEAEGT